ncbi:uncharacterized protein LOC141594119 [Silene latifolia]|uniref:uncharacterized protein LOC141594119 n=1 Tax=Silene latifolia TaxID=37657 RepID=UPI003D778B45
MAPMICFDIVEWHFPNRVARQFGWKQIIPLNSDTEPKLHKVDKRGASSRNWMEKHQPYISNWVRRGDFRFRGEEDDIEMNYYDPYMVWYRDRTILRLNPFPPQATYQAPFGATEYLAQGFVNVHNTCDTELRQMPLEVPPHFRTMVSHLRDYSSQSLEHVGYSHLLQPTVEPRQESSPMVQESLNSMNVDDDAPLVQYTRRGRRSKSSMPARHSMSSMPSMSSMSAMSSMPSMSSMSPVNEEGTPEPKKGFWNRLRGKSKKKT